MKIGKALEYQGTRECWYFYCYLFIWEGNRRNGFFLESLYPVTYWFQLKEWPTGFIDKKTKKKAWFVVRFLHMIMKSGHDNSLVATFTRSKLFYNNSNIGN